MDQGDQVCVHMLIEKWLPCQQEEPYAKTDIGGKYEFIWTGLFEQAEVGQSYLTINGIHDLWKLVDQLNWSNGSTYVTWVHKEKFMNHRADIL